MTTDPFAPPVDAVHAVQPDGELFVWKPHPHIVIEQARGVFSLPFAQVLGEFFRPILAARDVSIHIFADFESLTYNTREARQLFDLAQLRAASRDPEGHAHPVFGQGDRARRLGVQARHG